MSKIPFLNLLTVFFLIICLSGVASGYELRNKSYQVVSEDYTEYLIAAYGDVPVYDQNGEVVDTGVIKDLPDKKALNDWYCDIDLIVEDAHQDIEAYYYPEGPVLSYGYDRLGTVRVGIYEETDFDREMMDEIYRVISSRASEFGIDDVPVIFVSEPIPDIGMPYYKPEWVWVIIGVQNTVRDLFGTDIFAATGI